MSIQEAIDLFIRRKRVDWKGGTERTYRRNLSHFSDYAEEDGIETLDDLTRWNVGAFTDYLLDQEYARATVAGRQKTAKTWLKYLEAQGLVPHGYHHAIDTLKLEDHEETSDEILAPEEAHRLLTFYRDSPAWRGTRRHAVLEVLWHVGCRMGGLRALDLEDFDRATGDLEFRNRPDTDTRLKRGRKHQRNVTLSDKPKEILKLYLVRERMDVRDEYGRKPLFPSRQGRAVLSTIRGWMYLATQPCMATECPHGKRRPNCEYVPRNHASKCPSTRAPHAIRRGSITWQRNLGFDIDTVAERAAATPDVIRRYYDKPNYEAELERRREDTQRIDVTEHLHPNDLSEGE